MQDSSDLLLFEFAMFVYDNIWLYFNIASLLLHLSIISNFAG